MAYGGLRACVLRAAPTSDFFAGYSVASDPMRVLVRWVDDLDRDQDDSQVSDLHQQPMQLRLVGDGTSEACSAVAFVCQGEVPEPPGLEVWFVTI